MNSPTLRGRTCCRNVWSVAWTSCTTLCSTRRVAHHRAALQTSGSTLLFTAAALNSERSRCLHAQFTRLRYAVRTQGTGFPLAERDRLGIRGMVPPRELNIEAQAQKVWEEFERRPSNLDKWLALQALQDRNETLFYKVIIDHVEETAPIIYTRACRTAGGGWQRR